MIHRSVIVCVYCSILIISIYRYYATNEPNPSLRRMIAYSSPMLTEDDSATKKLPIFLQYSICSQDGVENLQLKPHGNAENFCHPFTSTLPSVLWQIKVILILKLTNTGVSFLSLVSTTIH